MFIYRKNFPIFFYLQTDLQKNKSQPSRVFGSFFRRQRLIKDRGVQICGPPLWIELSEFDGDGVRVLSPVIIIAQIDTRTLRVFNQKINLELQLFE